MLPEFRSQLFQLPLITTTWTSARNRYIREKENSLVPIRFILSIIEQAILLVHRIVIRPLPSPYHTYCKLFLSAFSLSEGQRNLQKAIASTPDKTFFLYSNFFSE